MSRPRAVVLDVGGVLFTPHPAAVLTALRESGAPAANDDVERAHYAGVRAIDALSGTHRDGEATTSAAYFNGFTTALGVTVDDRPAAVDALTRLWADPTADLWTQPTPGSRSALHRLAQAAIPIAVVSNSDGTVEANLGRAEVCQVGSGAGVEVRAIVDSAVVGVAKPDPRIFGYALDALGVAPTEAVHVGDTVRYDVNGARAAGLTALHLDPYRLCPGTDHRHETTLDGVVSWVLEA